MQQTSKYQFNLVDATDDFSPDPLNQNAEKTETLIAGVESDLAALTTAVGEGGHNCRIAFGSYQGTGTYGAGSPNSLTLISALWRCGWVRPSGPVFPAGPQCSCGPALSHPRM